jgi:hypothetical protein
VVLDTLNRSLQGSESSDEDMTAYVRAADALREAFGCAVLIVHHCGIDGTRPRGHTSLTGAVDAQLAVKRDGAGNIEVKVEWMKDGPEGDTIYSRLEAVDVGLDEDGEAITSCVIVPVQGVQIARDAPQLRGTSRAGLRALNECLADHGRAAPENNHVPIGKLSVTLDEWRDQLLKGGIINAEGNPREQFKRIRVTLINAGVIGVWDNLAWVSQPVTARHSDERDSTDWPSRHVTPP